MNALVTGSGGFVGEFLVSTLKNRGYAVTEFDLEHGDNILNKKKLKEKMKDTDIVFHLAAIINNGNPKLKKINVTGTKRVMDAAVESRVKKVVFMSSTGVYGFSTGLVDELTPVSPTTEYEKSKVKAEKEVLERQEEIFVCVVRSSMILGPNQYWKKMFRMIQKKFPLPIPGNNSFQIIYVKDLADALIKVMQKGENGELYLAASSEYITLNNFCKKAQKALNMKRKVRHMPAWLAIFLGKVLKIRVLNKDNIRHLMKERRYSTGKIQGIGWKPKHSMDQALCETLEELKEEGHFN